MGDKCKPVQYGDPDTFRMVSLISHFAVKMINLSSMDKC